MSTYTIGPPQKFSPAYNEVIFVAASSYPTDNPSWTGYTYVCKVYASDGTTLLATLKQFPRPDGTAVFDLHRVLENLLSYDINTATGVVWGQNSNSYIGYWAKFGHEYYDGSGVFQAYAQIVAGAVKYVYNAIFDFPDFPSYSQTNWLLVSGAINKYLTNSPRTQNIRTGCNAWLHVMTDTAHAAEYAKVTMYDSAGSVLGTVTMTSAYNTLPQEQSRFLRFPSGTNNIVGLGTPDHYTIQVFDSTNNPVSEIMTYQVVDSCTKYSWFRLHFLNKMGGFDSFDFGMKNHKSIDVTRQLYKRVYGDVTGGVWGYSAQERGYTQFDTLINQKHIIESDWITDAQATWLEELVTSPVVFAELAVGSLTPINIDNATYEIMQKANQKLQNLQIQFTYAYDKYRQRG
jgi:hypothetical protein